MSELRNIHFELSTDQLGFLNRLKADVVSRCNDCRVAQKELCDNHYRDLVRVRELLSMNIPKEYWNLDLDYEPVDVEARKLVGQYIEHIEHFKVRGLGLLLYGPHGTGKTALAIRGAVAAFDKGFSVYFYPAVELIDEIVRGFNDITLRERTEHIVSTADFLILDDLGKEDRGIRENLAATVRVRLDKILRLRKGRMMPVIGSTNLDPMEGIKEFYSESILSVCRESMKAIYVPGDDLRAGKAKRTWTEVLSGATGTGNECSGGDNQGEDWG